MARTIAAHLHYKRDLRTIRRVSAPPRRLEAQPTLGVDPIERREPLSRVVPAWEQPLAPFRRASDTSSVRVGTSTICEAIEHATLKPCCRPLPILTIVCYGRT